MKTSAFRVAPVQRYSRPRYGSESHDNLIAHAVYLVWNFPEKIVKGAVTLLLCAGLSMGLQACSDGNDTNGSKYPQITDGVPVAECSPNQVTCTSEETALVCRSDGHKEAMSCQQACEEVYGNEFYSRGCSPEKLENPCECDYEIVDGDMSNISDGDIDLDDPPADRDKEYDMLEGIDSVIYPGELEEDESFEVGESEEDAGDGDIEESSPATDGDGLEYDTTEGIDSAV